MALGKLDIHMQKKRIWPLFYTVHKIKSKWVKDLNVRSETTKLLEENVGGKLPDIGRGNEFLDMMPSIQGTNVKIGKGNCIKLKSLYTAKETVNKLEKTTYGMRENVCKPCI